MSAPTLPSDILRRAALTTCGSAYDLGDARLLMDILGLIPDAAAVPTEAAELDMATQHAARDPRACVDCGRSTVPQHRWRRMDTHEREGLVPAGSHGMCDTCCKRARYHRTLPNPAPSRLREPDPVAVKVAAIYTVHCEICGDLDTLTDRGHAYGLRIEHVIEHRSTEASQP